MVAFTKPERKVDEEAFNDGIQEWWNGVFDRARVHMDYELRECAKEAYDVSQHRKGDLRLRACLPTKLAVWLDAQYGEGWRTDRDFIKCYQKYMGQTFLGDPSSEFGK